MNFFQLLKKNAKTTALKDLTSSKNIKLRLLQKKAYNDALLIRSDSDLLISDIK